MSTDYLPKITPRDLGFLEAMLDGGLDGGEKLIGAIRSKLQRAQIVFADDMPANVVTLGTRLAFQVDDRPIDERTLVTVEQYAPGQGHQSIASARGIAMLGLAEGNFIEFEREDRTELLSIIQVLYQPEADRKRRKAPAGLRVVSSREDLARPAAAKRSSHPQNDDPGPSAA